MLTRVTIDSSALRHNVEILSGICADSQFMAVVKSNAYGHGLNKIVPMLSGSVDRFGVNSIEEACIVREMDPETSILIMGMNDPADYPEIPPSCPLVLSSLDHIRELMLIRPTVPFHLKVDTGMSRLGQSGSTFRKVLDFLSENPQMPWSGLMTHFANVEDVTDQSYAKEQLDNFSEAVKLAQLASCGRKLRFHCAASSAALILPESRMDIVRFGISLYGFWPSVSTRISAHGMYGQLPELRPVLSWTTKIVHINRIESGRNIGYGCTVRLPYEASIAVLPVGYFEGYERSLSNRSHVLIRGKRARLVGRVCMNMIMVDVTHIENARPGDEAVLIGASESEKITAEDLADLTGTIQYEVVSRIQKDIARFVV